MNSNDVLKEEPQAPLRPPHSDAALPTHIAAAVHPIMSPPSKRQDLPKFAANGMIPFASNPKSALASMGASMVPGHQAEGDTKSKAAEELRDIWEVPKTPTR